MDWDTLRRLIEEADLDALVSGLRELDPKQQQELAKPLVEYERLARRSESFWDFRRHSALLAVAGAGVLRMSALAPWLVRNNLDQPMHWDGPLLVPHGRAATDCVREVLVARGVHWLPDLAERMAQRLRPRGFPNQALWSLITALAGDELPSSDGFVFHWLYMVDYRVSSIVQHFREDERFLPLVPRLFEVDGVARKLAPRFPDDPGWPDALATLAAEGKVDRLVLLDGLLARLQRGGKQMDVTALVSLHDLLAPSLDEVAERAADYAALVPDAYSTVAGMAQRELLRLDEAGRLASETLLDVSQAVFLRSEKKLVRAQLSWLDTAVRRGRGEALQPLTALFGHESVDLQERALKLVLKHREQIAPDSLAEFGAAAASLSPDLRDRAAEAFGRVDAAPEPVLTAPVLPRPEMPPPIASLDELATEATAYFGSRPTDSVVVERLLAGLVEFAFADREALHRAFEPLVATYPWLSPGLPDWTEPLWYYHNEGTEFSAVFKAALGDCRGDVRSPIPADLPGEAEWLRSVTEGVDRATLWMLRLHEMALGLAHAPRPFLLATPTDPAGLIDPESLLGRLALAAEQGWQPWEHDLVQAMLRLPREVDGAVASRMRELGAAGSRVAQWIDDGGLGEPEVRREVRPVRRYSWRGGGFEDRTRVVVTFPDSAGSVRKSFDTEKAGDYSLHVNWSVCFPNTLPAHRDVTAAHLAPSFADGGPQNGPVLEKLVNGHGPIGDGMNTVLAFALGSRRADNRLSAVDALITLAGREELRGAELGHAVADLVVRDEVVLSRVVQAVRDAARAGVGRPAWEAVAVLIERLLPADGDRPRTGLPDLLGLGVELAGQVRPDGPVPGLAAIADRTGTSRFVKEARRLQRALAAA
jgi:hypothetical protein